MNHLAPVLAAMAAIVVVSGIILGAWAVFEPVIRLFGWLGARKGGHS